MPDLPLGLLLGMAYCRMHGPLLPMVRGCSGRACTSHVAGDSVHSYNCPSPVADPDPGTRYVTTDAVR
jgi:hypothetical protein